MKRAWSASESEEVISCLYLIAALLAVIAGIKWFAVLLFVKCALDMICSVVLAIIETKNEIKEESK